MTRYLSPFRYPGGKTWLIPRIRQWLKSRAYSVTEFVEPFAGGASVGLTAALESLADHVTLIELDPEVASVWQTILNGQGQWLADRIETFPISRGAVKEALAAPIQSKRELAFQTILRNRVQHGGILAPGAGILKNGENGRGVGSRWYPRTLSMRIRDIIKERDRITFRQCDGMTVLHCYSRRPDAAFFIDPPYSAGCRLYGHHIIDHEKLFSLACDLAGEFLMTYDNTEEVRGLARRFGFQTRLIAMKSTHHAAKTELLIGRNLNSIASGTMDPSWPFISVGEP